MKATVMPTTRWGKTSVVCFALLPVMFFISMLFLSFYGGRDIEAGDTIIQDVQQRPGIASPMILLWTASQIALFTGLYAMIREHERSLIVLVGVSLGLLLLLFGIGEFVSPH